MTTGINHTSADCSFWGFSPPQFVCVTAVWCNGGRAALSLLKHFVSEMMCESRDDYRSLLHSVSLSLSLARSFSASSIESHV